MEKIKIDYQFIVRYSNDKTEYYIERFYRELTDEELQEAMDRIMTDLSKQYEYKNIFVKSMMLDRINII